MPAGVVVVAEEVAAGAGLGASEKVAAVVVVTVVAGEAPAKAGVTVGVVAGGVVVGGVVVGGVVVIKVRAADVTAGVGATGVDASGVVNAGVATEEAGGCPSTAVPTGRSVREGGGVEEADRSPTKKKNHRQKSKKENR